MVGGTYKKGGKRDLESKELLAMLNMWQSKKQLKLLGQVLKGQKTGMKVRKVCETEAARNTVDSR